MERPQGLDASPKRQRIAQDAGGYIKHPDPEHWTGGGWNVKNTRSSNADIPYLQAMAANKRQLGDRTEEYGGNSDNSSSDRLTEEQENEIAENIYDWWISGKSYKKWYAEKFLQKKQEF